MDKAQEEFTNMLEELNAVNDEFVNGYFDDESISIVEKKSENNEEPINDSNEIDSKIEFAVPEDFNTEEELEKTKSYSKSFSYNEILNRLDNKQNIDINNSDDILNLIENSNTPDEFFDALNEDDIND